MCWLLAAARRVWLRRFRPVGWGQKPFWWSELPVGRNDDDRGRHFPGLFHAWGKQLLAGIGWELVTKTVAMDGGRLLDQQFMQNGVA